MIDVILLFGRKSVTSQKVRASRLRPPFALSPFGNAREKTGDRD